MYMSLADKNKQTFLDDQYVRPVESIMKCEDFKSNFARRLSNRYISKPSVTFRQESVLKLRSLESTKAQDIEQSEPAVKEDRKKLFENMEQIREPVKPSDKNATKNSEIRCTEVTALNLEVETLRWQLAQTESNRQMHIALLKQILSFLNRIKEHMENQKKDGCNKKHTISRNSSVPTNPMNLPKARAVLCVNKNDRHPASPTMRMNIRTISKSITNVSNEFQHIENNHLAGRSHLNLPLALQCDTTQKLTEEIASLITLANTVMSTKIPDLACSCNENGRATNKPNDKEDNHKSYIPSKDINANLEIVEENASCSYSLNKYGNLIEQTSILDEFVDVEDKSLDLIMLQSPLIEEAENYYECIDEKENPENSNESPIKEKLVEMGCENNVAFIEDESGFSSMSSFQEIGIPIINVIPPTPNKEITLQESSGGISVENNNWVNESVEMGKQPVKVFWV